MTKRQPRRCRKSLPSRHKKWQRRNLPQQKPSRLMIDDGFSWSVMEGGQFLRSWCCILIRVNFFCIYTYIYIFIVLYFIPIYTTSLCGVLQHSYFCPLGQWSNLITKRYVSNRLICLANLVHHYLTTIIITLEFFLEVSHPLKKLAVPLGWW